MYIYIYICVCVNDYVIYKCDQTGPSSHNDFLSAGTPEFVSLNCHLIASVTVPCSVPEKMHTVRVAESCLIHFGRAVNIDC